MKLIETDVLVVGAGPAGLTASALLARAGVKAIGITKYGGTSDSPRAHITNQRTVEVLRDLGVEGRLREAAMPQNIMGIQIFATSFAGIELSRTMAWGAGIDRRTDYERASPSAMCNISQHKLEPINPRSRAAAWSPNSLQLGAGRSGTGSGGGDGKDSRSLERERA
jgi:2,4-dichlorophenol 6-monooxygenase